MDDHLKEALDIVKAQASVRIMSEDEIISMVRRLSSDIKNVAEGEGCVEELARKVDYLHGMRQDIQNFDA